MNGLMKMLALAAAVGIAAAGCGDDDGGTDPGGTDAGGGTDASGATTDLCTNPSDAAAVQADYEGRMVADIAADCGVMCASDPDPGGCTSACIVEDTMMAVSGSCASCYAMSVTCTIDNCLGACISDPTSAECTACRCGGNEAMINCIDDVFTPCSGIPSDTCAGM